MSADITDEQSQDWFFTFGIEHQVAGIPLGRRFVRFHGTWMEAREQMLAHFAREFCAQYDSPEAAGVAKYHLTELVLPLQEATR